MPQVIWQAPAVLFALAAVAAPILIHLLVQRRAEPLPFPTLRFLRPTRLAAFRRHLLDDAALLAVRASIVAAAVAALAGPLLITPARTQGWDRRIVRAVVVDEALDPARRGDAGPAPVFRSQQFTAASLADGIGRAVAWLQASPPARRELAIVSPFPIGSITTADLETIPATVGIRLERAGTLPAARTVDAGRVLTPERVIARTASLDGVRTIVRDTPVAGPLVWPIEIVNAPEAQPAVDAAVAAVLAQRVPVPAANRRARVVIGQPSPIGAAAGSIRTAWIADGAAQVMRDADLRSAAARLAGGFGDARLSTPPWLTLATAGGGRPIAVAAESQGRLVVASAAPAGDLFTPILLRAIAHTLGEEPDLSRAEIVSIADSWLRAHERAPAAASLPSRDNQPRDDAEDDRRWLWVAVLCLLAIETWMRRTATVEQRAEDARVA